MLLSQEFVQQLQLTSLQPEFARRRLVNRLLSESGDKFELLNKVETENQSRRKEISMFTLWHNTSMPSSI